VLIAMATATTLTLGWLASQDNASIVGSNIARAAEARAIASSGVELAAAIAQTETDWRTIGGDGILLSNYPIGNGTIDLSVLDRATNAPPTADSTDLLVTANGRIGELSQVVTASISLLEDDDGTIQGQVDDFALFALASIELADRALVQRWLDAPASDLGRRVAVGTSNRSAHAIRIRGEAAVIDGTAYHSRNASPAYMTNASRHDVRSVPLDWTPTLAGSGSPLPPRHEPSKRRSRRHLKHDSDDVVVRRNRTLHLPGDEAFVVAGNLILEHGAHVVVHGSAPLQIAGDLLMNTSRITLAPGAELHAVIGGGIELVDATIGCTDQGWSDPERVRIACTPGASTADAWRMSGRSVITGIIEGEGIDLLLEDQSTVRGRLAANSIRMQDESCLFYDHGLGSGLGVTRAADLIADHQNKGRGRSHRMAELPMQFMDELLSVCQGGNVDARTDRPPPSHSNSWRGSPTPRPVAIEFQLLAHGTDPGTFEKAALALRETGP